MNYCGSGFRYKKIEKNILIKNDNSQASFQTSKQQSKQTITNINCNSYTGKNYSSIKSLIKRLQASGHNKINYPRIKTRNQRADIFLRGGAINNIKNIDFLENPNLPVKKSPLQRKKAIIKLEFNQQSSDDIQQVYISKNIPLEPRRQQVYKSSQTVKTQIQKPFILNSIAKTFDRRFINQSPPLENVNMKTFQQEIIQNQYQSHTTLKYQRKTLIRSLKQTEIHPVKIQKRNISTCLGTKFQQNLSENNIPTYTTESRKVKIPRSIVKSICQQKNQIKRPIQISDPKKPLFYISQDELRNLNLTTKSFIVMQYPSKQIITGTYFRQVAQIASLTKIITFYCCLLLLQKYQLNMDEQILIINQQVESITGTSAQLQEGDAFTFRQICYGLMLPSGNDAALALAIWGGKNIKKYQDQTESDIKVFMTYMNATCSAIGMKSSFFGNPHGLPHPKSGSTVEDVAIVIYEALKIQFFREVIGSKQYKCIIQNNGISRQILWQNTNKLLRRNGFIGVKTGVTVTAGPCLSTCYQINDKIYIIVLLKTSKLSKRFKQTRKILGKILSKLNWNQYKKQIKQIEKNDIELDSDNSQDQQQFNYDKNDAQQMKKRLKIITYQM